MTSHWDHDAERASFDVFFDFTCQFSYRAHVWLQETGARPTWRPFSLLQLNRGGEGESVWRSQEYADNISLLLFAGYELVRSRGGRADAYRDHVFRTYHETDGRLGLDDVVHIAGEAGVQADESSVREHHLDAEAEHQAALAEGVFGTPTLVFGPECAAYVKLAAIPEPGQALDVLDSLSKTAGMPSVLELKRVQSTGMTG